MAVTETIKALLIRFSWAVFYFNITWLHSLHRLPSNFKETVLTLANTLPHLEDPLSKFPWSLFVRWHTFRGQQQWSNIRCRQLAFGVRVVPYRNELPGEIGNASVQIPFKARGVPSTPLSSHSHSPKNPCHTTRSHPNAWIHIYVDIPDHQ